MQTAPRTASRRIYGRHGRNEKRRIAVYGAITITAIYSKVWKMKRAILLILLCVIIALIDAPISVSDDIQKSILPETIIADYVYIYEYDGRIKTSCRRGEYDMPQVGSWYALENETYVITNARLVWCNDMRNDEILVSVYCEKLQNYLTK